MAIMTNYSLDNVLRLNYGDTELAKRSMENSVRLCIPRRKNVIVRSRIKSAIKIIRALKA